MSTEAEAVPTVYSRKNPFPATMLVNRRLSGPESAKNTRHFELTLRGSGLTYEVGDALGVFPANTPELVDEVIRALGFSGDETVSSPDGHPVRFREALTSDCQIRTPQRKFLTAIAEKDPASTFLKDLLDPEVRTQLDYYLDGREIIDILLDAPGAKFEPQEFIGAIGKLQPRLYSIASSIKAHPEEVHLTVDTVIYESFGRKRKGVCSTFLAERVGRDTPVPVFVHIAKHFRMPESGDVPIIMVGPGTGIAPFRAFLEERSTTGAKGKNWLFFGSQKAACDFFYGDELTSFQRQGVLTRLDLAFSRDQAHKIYVQHRMIEHAEELWRWLDEGAYFYVCGDARRMAKDVDEALQAIPQKAAGYTPEQAKEYVETLKKEKRYRRDVY